jgi:hypothetical protein
MALQLQFASILASNKTVFPYSIIVNLIAATILDGFPPVGYNLEYEIPKKHSCEVWFILA